MDAYLKQVDPDYAKAAPSDRAAYISHLKGLDKPTAFEQQHENTTVADYRRNLGQYGSEPERLAARALTSAGLPETPEQIPSWASNAYNSALGIKPAIENVTEAFQHPSQRSVVKAVPFIGPLSVSMADAAKQKDYSGAAADLVGALAATKAISQVKPGLKAAKSELVDATRTPEGKLNPATKTLSKIAGAAAGHTLGIPGAGEIGGYFLGPQVADMMLPNRPPETNFFGGAYTDPFSPPGAPLPSADEFYANEGKLRMSLLKQAAQRGDVNPMNPFAPPVEQAAPSVYAPGELSPDDLISRTKKLAIPGEAPTAGDLKRAGDFTQVSTEKLRTLAKFGDKLAQNELIRRQKQ